MSLETKKQNLEVYVCLDVDKTRVDTDMIHLSIKVFITIHNPEYNLKLLQEVNTDIISLGKEDVIQRGMYCFGMMFETLKLKTKDNVWFLYIGSGGLKMMAGSEVTLLLLNKSPSVRECFYTLNKKGVTVYKDQPEHVKLENIQVIKRSLDELFTTKKTIKYQPPSLLNRATT